MADYPWLPTLEDVADYVPTRTVPEDTPGQDDPLGTFTSATTPTADAVTRLILRAASEVQVAIGEDVPTELHDAAKTATALRAAAFVELAYPRRDADVNVASSLLAEANRALERGRVAIITLPDSSVGASPLWEFPDPVAYGDVNIL